jgi:hypothetical protein
MNDQLSIVHEHELRELITALDAALEVLDDCGFRDASDDVLGLTLHDYHAVKQVIARAAAYLVELRP